MTEIPGFDDAVAALRAGEVVGVPTDTVYGLVAAPDAAGRIYEVKGRPAALELPVLVADLDQARTVGVLPDGGAAAGLAARFWPGGLTIVVPRVGPGPGPTVGLRVPAHDVPRALCRAVGPLASTSANRHGEPPATTAAEVRALEGVAVVLDGGPCVGAPSTVVDCTGDRPRVLREGTIPTGSLDLRDP